LFCFKSFGACECHLFCTGVACSLETLPRTTVLLCEAFTVCDLGAMLKARAVVKLNRVVWRPMTEALGRAPNSWAARLEAIVLVRDVTIFFGSLVRIEEAILILEVLKLLFGL
jgi:hypothetical protein